MQLKCSQPTYFKEKQITVGRHNPSVVLAAGPTRGSNQFSGICPVRTYTYSIAANSQVCGASYFTWNFPQSWQVNNGQIGDPNPPVAHTFWLSSQNSSQVTIQTSQNPTSGPITVTAHFNGCNSVTTTLNASILTAPPSSISFVNEDFEFFHCGEWKLCSTGGQLPIAEQGADFVDYYTFTIDPPRYFTSPEGPVQQKVVAYGHPDFGRTPIIQGSGGATNLTVAATNCISTGRMSNITIVDEDPAWCSGSPNWQPYPIGCVCCEPTGDPNPRKTEESRNEVSLTPNPTNGWILIKLPSSIRAEVFIFSADGRLAEKFTIESEAFEHNLPAKLQNGVYNVRITQGDAVVTQKLILMR